jgi:hypothetical protein
VQVDSLFKQRYPLSPFTLSMKAAVPSASTTNPLYAGNLLPPAVDPFTDLVRREVTGH